MCTSLRERRAQPERRRWDAESRHFIYDDPHLDLVLTHHREEHCIEAFLQPRFTHGLLFAN